MAPTVAECMCDVAFSEQVKEYVRYKLGDFPFTTARKINHQRCISCHGICAADTNKELTDDMCKNRLFIQEQDKMFSIADNSPIVPLHNNTSAKEYTAPIQYKQWHMGCINYLRQVVNGDKVSIVPASQTYEVYCDYDDRLSVAARQFIKPDDYFKLTSIV